MAQGELWWINNKRCYEASNRGDDWWIHLVFDLLPNAAAAAPPEPLCGLPEESAT
jgi:hypothetical protein